jgi:hypothetical protein
MIESNRIVFDDNKIFKNNFSHSIIEKTVAIIREYRCTPEVN